MNHLSNQFDIMSLESWCEEFYPIPASDVPAADAIAHSLQKWRGLLPENLTRHSLRAFHDIAAITDIDHPPGRYIPPQDRLDIDDRSCALCTHHIRSARADQCRTCPLHILLGRDCDASTSYNHEPPAPYDHWRDTGDPLPMIRALETLFNQQ